MPAPQSYCHCWTDSVHDWLLQPWGSREPTALLFKSQNQEASDFLCWDGLPWDPAPQPWACVLRSLSKFSWILKPFRKPKIFGTQLTEFHSRHLLCCEISDQPFLQGRYLSNSGEEMGSLLRPPPKPGVLHSQKRWQQSAAWNGDS